MMFGEWKAKIYQPPGIIGYELWLFSKDGKHCLNHLGEMVELKEESTISANYFALFPNEDALKSIADELASFGVKTNNDHKNEGLLEATKAHLDDMRTLVFKDKK